VGILAVVVLLVVGYQRFLAPDPETVEAIAREMEAEHLVTEENDLTAALTEVNVGLTYEPENVELLVFKGALHEALGEPEAAAQAYAEAERLAEDRERFLTSRAQRHLMVGNEEEALADARRLLELNPNSAHAYYFRGVVAEQRADWVAAYGNYETASELAMDANQSEFYVFLRARMAEVLRRLTPPTGTPSAGTSTE
jgi:tetratricopeptide (TPR) repeat protein